MSDSDIGLSEVGLGMATDKPFDAATDAKYVQLTTFRKDGTPVSSPLWAAYDLSLIHISEPTRPY